MADQVNHEHKQYCEYADLWKKCRVVTEGEEAVKKERTKYLPMLTDQSTTDYDAYLMRAMFYEATGRTLQGLVGALHHKAPTLIDPTGKTDMKFFDDLVPNFMPFKSFLRDISEETLVTGRIGILVDVPKDTVGGKPFIVSYCAEDIINWRTRWYEGKEVLDLVVLQEQDQQVGEFETVCETQWRVLRMNQAKQYEQLVYKQDAKTKAFFVVEGPIVPTITGVPLDHIPFYFINCGGTTSYCYRPPLLALVNVNLSHYRNSADLEHGRHYTGLPTAWVAGFEGTDKNPLMLGSSKAWVSNNPQARAGFLEFTGQGLKTLETALETKEELMAVLGARLLEAPKNVAESADNQMVRRSAENSVISNIAETISEGMTKVCKEAARWMRLDDSKVSVEIPKEYLDMPIDAQLLGQLMAGLQGGTLSYDTWFYNMKRMKVVPDGRTQEEELNLIDEGRFGGLAFYSAGLNPDGTPIKEEPEEPKKSEEG